MNTLLAYASTHGAAALCARKIAEKLDGSVQFADLKQAGAVSLRDYDRVVLGTSIYAGNAQKEARNFCRKYESELAAKPLGIFFSCMEEDREALEGYLKRNFPVSLIGHLAAFGSMGGAFYFSKMNFVERSVIKFMMKAAKSKGNDALPDGKSDYVTISDEKIAAFAEEMNRLGAVAGK